MNLIGKICGVVFSSLFSGFIAYTGFRFIKDIAKEVGIKAPLFGWFATRVLFLVWLLRTLSAAGHVWVSAAGVENVPQWAAILFATVEIGSDKTLDHY